MSANSTSIDGHPAAKAPAASGHSADAGAAGDIGPNAVTQLVAAVTAEGLQEIAGPIFAAAGVPDWITSPPDAMVDERPVARLHQAFRAALPPDDAARLMAEAGRLTAEYLLANRIPRSAQIVLKLLPARFAARVLVPAIRAHAWTFAGSGRFSATAGPPTVFELRGNPLCAGEHSPRKVCTWHAAVFRRLFRVLVSPAAEVVETDCEARGDSCCRFEVDWRRFRRG